MEGILVGATAWTKISARELHQLSTAAQSIRANGALSSVGANISAWNQQLKDMSRNEGADIRWAAAFLIGATARAAESATILEHAAGWMQSIVPLVKSSEQDYVQCIATLAACDILQHCQGRPQILKLDSSMVLSKLMPALTKLRAIPSLRLPALIATYSLMRSLTTTLRPYTELIEGDCTLFLNSASPSVQQTAALCIGCIPACTATQKNDFADWQLCLQRLLTQAQHELDNFLPNSSERGGSHAGSLSAPGSGTGVLKFTGLCQAISAILNLPLPQRMPPVLVPVGSILQMLFRILQVTDVGSVGASISAMVPRLHVDALKLLGAVVTCAGRRMLPFASTLGELLSLCIGRSAETILGSAPAVRESTYDCADVCLRHLGSAVGDFLVEGEIVGHLVADLSKQTAHLEEHSDRQGQNNPLHSGSARKRKKERRPSQQQGSELAQTNSNVLRPFYADVACHCSGARLLRTLVRTCGVTLPISTRLEIDRAAVKWLTANTESCASIAIDFTATQLCCYDLLVYSLVHPIGVAKVQTQAYVYSSRDDTAATEPTAQPDLLPIARQLFVAGVSQSNAFIAEACTRGLQVCEIHAHARARPLYFQQRGSSVAAPVVMQGDEAAQELQGSQRVGTVPQASYLMASATQRQYESMFQQNPVGPEGTQ